MGRWKGCKVTRVQGNRVKKKENGKMEKWRDGIFILINPFL
jgi:hypothetical protein